MTSFLIKFFIKDYENVKSHDVRHKYGSLAATLGFISNIILAAVKLTVGSLTASVAIISDGVNNLSDTASSIVAWIGFKLSSKPEDEDHPYGHARMEHIAGVIISVLIIVVSFELLQISVAKVINPTPTSYSITAVALLIIAVFFKVWQYFFYTGISRKISSNALKASAIDSRNDVITTLVVLISIAVEYLFNFSVEGYAGVIISLFIGYSGIMLIKETISPLLGEVPDIQLVSEIYSISNSHSDVLGVHDLIVHNYGAGKVFASIHIEVDSTLALLTSHEVIDNIEEKVKTLLNVSLTAHIDPVDIHDQKRVAILNNIKRCSQEILEVHSPHDLRIIEKEGNTHIIFEVIQGYPQTLSHEDIKNCFTESICKEFSHCTVTIKVDKQYYKV